MFRTYVATADLVASCWLVPLTRVTLRAEPTNPDRSIPNEGTSECTSNNEEPCIGQSMGLSSRGPSSSWRRKMSTGLRQNEVDRCLMQRAIARAWHSRLMAPPNPWVGCLIVTPDGTTFEGRTQRPGGQHAERQALDIAGPSSVGATMYTTLEPCSHTGRTGPCTKAIIEAQIDRVVIGVLDPDPNVSGNGLGQLREAGIEVTVGTEAHAVEDQLAPYLHHRRTGLPWVLLKLASTVDGKTAAQDGTSQWITGDEARLDAHHLRANSDAILVGAGTVRVDNPSLTVRGVVAPDGKAPRQPLRVVLGSAASNAKIQPCREMSGDLNEILRDLGSDGVVQLMIEGGAAVAGAFHAAGLVNQYVLYLAPALMGGGGGLPMLGGSGTPTISKLPRGRFDQVRFVGDDLRIDLILDESEE